MPVIRLENLSKRYGNVEVLHGINLEMQDAEFTVLVGPSGCGKSTTLRMIAGLETVSAGEIFIADKPVSKLEPKERDLAMVFQDYALYPHMNVFKNMSFALRLQKRPKKEIAEKVGTVADMLGLTDFLNRKPAELSGGQRQRVAMGRALTRDSSTFLFDEPLSNLDAKLRTQMRAELALMRQKVHKNMIYVTHDQIEAMTLADRIVVMHAGKIQQQGTPEELFKKPVNKFVAGFLGMPPMNFVNATLQHDNDQLYLNGEGFRLRCADSLKKPLSDNNSTDLVLGMRPSDLHLDASAKLDESFDVKIVVSEYIGAQSVLIGDCSGQNLVIELNSDTPFGAAERTRFKVDSKNIHFFNKSSEMAIPV